MLSRVQRSIRSAETEQRKSVRADKAGRLTDTAGRLRAPSQLRAQRARTHSSWELRDATTGGIRRSFQRKVRARGESGLSFERSGPAASARPLYPSPLQQLSNSTWRVTMGPRYEGFETTSSPPGPGSARSTTCF